MAYAKNIIDDSSQINSFKFDKYKNRQKILIKHSILVAVGYILCCLTIVAGKLSHLTSITWWQIAFCLFLSIGCMSLYIVVLSLKKKITSLYANLVYLSQFVLWLILYIFFTLWINEVRFMALLFALTALIFVISNSSMVQSLILSGCAIIITIAGSYYSIYYNAQAGNFKLELYYALYFIPVSAYLSYIAGTIKKQKKEINKAKRNAIEVSNALWGEMELAKKIQTALLPKNPFIDGYEIAGYMNPADEVGGDYYDVIKAADRNWLVIGDVSGHGVPSGLVMMMVQTSIHLVLYQNPDLPPSELLVIVNRVIAENIKNLGEEKYMTISVLALHDNGHLIFSGLHQDMFVFRSKEKKLEICETQGMWLGIVDNIENMVKLDNLSLDVGDILLLYTDGLTEAYKYDEEKSGDVMYGDVQLMEVFLDLGDKSVAEIRDGIVGSLEGYTCNDDVTMLIFKRMK